MRPVFLIYRSKGQFECFHLWWLRRWLNRPGWSSMALLLVFRLHFYLSVSCSLAIWIFTCFLYPADTCHQVFTCLLHFQTKVQPAAGGAPWLQGGELPHACPPCSAAQRACSGGKFGNFGNFCNFRIAYIHGLFSSVTMPINNDSHVRTWALDTTSHCRGLATSTGRFSHSRSWSFSEDESPETLGVIISFIVISV